MSSSALFAPQNKGNEASYVYQFRAGKMIQDGKIVTADPRRGCVYLYVSQKSHLHFCWFDRSTGFIEDNFVVDPEKFSFKKVSQCKDGRVYRFKTGDKRFFIWMQENEEEESHVYENMKIHLNNHSKNQDFFHVIIKIKAMGVYADTNTPLRKLSSKPGSSSKSKTKIQLDDLRNIMSSIGAGSQDFSSKKKLDLNNVVNAENINQIVASVDSKNALQALLPPLPKENDPLLDLVKTSFVDPLSHVRSAQFRSALNAFNAALHRGALGELVGQFKMGAQVTEAANKGDILEFAKALETKMKESTKDDKMDTS
ncbi:adhesion regulating molecule 1 [Cichlidogyrus casuarinus]|uniref:Adhesion regulating molecule 1 n=1 Tax=Cichlidogyrus casuarinus TaxID=1844966 RepID=A0ABD2QIJ7_9PLAT